MANPNPRDMRLVLLANGAVALAVSAITLVLLLIAPLGLAAVLTCTVLVALVSFAGGVVADLMLWRLLVPRLVARALSTPERGGVVDGSIDQPLLSQPRGRLPERRRP